ncbi:hypothetical protein [Mycobacterium riyadhense]|uniref:Uncharacterized protein n=1 Tax=Mycobacterium riyadhense TaxID=486698 RepID=A0A653F2S6_9MYCO|nr:hypothetical protein [Mycobacterium riyadhense]VTP03938.1 hypothetical protein BIN_B_05319 [Mycobacterium riyadhense]
MTTTPSTRLPDVPLPPGAFVDPGDAWEQWDYEFRVVRTAERHVSGHASLVSGSALQFPDGHIDDGTTYEAPVVWIEHYNTGLTIAQAREFAALLVSTADELDGWVAK